MSTRQRRQLEFLKRALFTDPDLAPTEVSMLVDLVIAMKENEETGALASTQMAAVQEAVRPHRARFGF